jgi:hypothetical protein
MGTLLLIGVVVIGALIALGAAFVRWVLRPVMNVWRRYA